MVAAVVTPQVLTDLSHAAPVVVEAAEVTAAREAAVVEARERRRARLLRCGPCVSALMTSL